MDETRRRVVDLACLRLRAACRLDLNELARALDVSRATLHRHAGDRATIAGEALWALTKQALAAADVLARADAGPGPHSAKVAAHYIDMVAGDLALRRLLDEEPEFAVRVLTAPDGVVQPRLIGAVTAMFERDMADGGWVPVIAPDRLAYAVVRLGESMLYSDILASRPVDAEAAKETVIALIQAGPVRRLDPPMPVALGA